MELKMKNWVIFFEEGVKISPAIYKDISLVFSKDIQNFGIENIFIVEYGVDKLFLEEIIQNNKVQINVEWCIMGNIDKDKGLIKNCDYCLFFSNKTINLDSYFWHLINYAKDKKKLIYITY